MDGRRSTTERRFVDRASRARGESHLHPHSPPARCSYCGRPFADDDLLALHRGLEHADRLSESERAAYESAAAAETRALRRYKLYFLFALAATYFGFLFLYAVFG